MKLPKHFLTLEMCFASRQVVDLHVFTSALAALLVTLNAPLQTLTRVLFSCRCQVVNVDTKLSLCFVLELKKSQHTLKHDCFFLFVFQKRKTSRITQLLLRQEMGSYVTRCTGQLFGP